MKLRITESMWNDLTTKLNSRKDVETAGVILAERVRSPNGDILIARQANLFPNNAYIVREIDQLSIDPISLNRITKPARDNNWSIFTIHTHPRASEAWFSQADDRGDARLMPAIHCQIPGRPHGSIVVTGGGKHICRAYNKSGQCSKIPIQVVGRTIDVSTDKHRRVGNWFSRQTLALGDTGQSKLQNIRVAIIGLGGIGSIVSMQLAHLGINQLVLVDGDIIEGSNISRIVGANKNDVGKSSKVDVAANYATALGLTQVIERHKHFLSDKDESLIASCDVVISCVDTHRARALLNRFSYKYHIPVIDLGTVFRVDKVGSITSDAGRVVVIGPGRPCLACWGHIDADAIRNESLSAVDIKERINDDYIQGAETPQPSVITFNTTVAGAGVTELLRMVTSFSGVETPPNRLGFSFSEGVIRRNTIAADAICSICN